MRFLEWIQIVLFFRVLTPGIIVPWILFPKIKVAIGACLVFRGGTKDAVVALGNINNKLPTAVCKPFKSFIFTVAHSSSIQVQQWP
jgi:hypothetical protein